jgi:hypothetical protein
VRHWRPYLWGRPFLVRTDHYSLKFLLDQRLSTIPQHQWASKLLGFDFWVEYRPGATNVVADALSRRDTEEQAALYTISAPSFKLLDDLRAHLAADKNLQDLRREILDGTHDAVWAVKDDLITRSGRIFLPASSPSLPEILAGAHGAGHEGVQKTLHQLRKDFFVPGARSAVQDYVRSRATCQRHKSEQLHPAGLLQPLDVPSAVWSDISMDFIEGFPKQPRWRVRSSPTSSAFTASPTPSSATEIPPSPARSGVSSSRCPRFIFTCQRHFIRSRTAKRKR